MKEYATTVMMSSDTGSTDKFWEVAASEDNVKLIIAHVSFSNRLADIPASSGHMTLSMLLERIDTYNLHHVPFYIAHMKTMFVDEITEEISVAMRENLFVLPQGPNAHLISLYTSLEAIESIVLEYVEAAHVWHSFLERAMAYGFEKKGIQAKPSCTRQPTMKY